MYNIMRNRARKPAKNPVIPQQRDLDTGDSSKPSSDRKEQKMSSFGNSELVKQEVESKAGEERKSAADKIATNSEFLSESNSSPKIESSILGH